MKAVMVMFDSLNRHMLPPYGCDWVHAPNFRRLAERSVVFDNSYVGSMPCMPARRELHTGRYNFLHRSWGPIEPFDDSMPEILKGKGVPTHLASDHYHYWEEGGCNYHTRYSNWEISRGQEGEPWRGDLRDPDIPEPNPGQRGAWGRQDWVNRAHMQNECDQPQARTVSMGLDYLDRNHDRDNWFLHIETFDPHEPYFCNERYKALYAHDFSRSPIDWPHYARVEKGQEALAEHLRFCNAALISMCDHHLGRVLDKMDEHGLWDDTLLIVNTDHGFLLGEHGWWGKCRMPFFNEVARTPLFIWDPRCALRGERRQALVQTIDLPATLLRYFGVDLPPDMQGRDLAATIARDAPVRDGALYGLFGGHVNCTDGRFVYMRGPRDPAGNAPLFEYTLMPSHMRRTFETRELQDIALADPFPFTKGCRTMKIAGRQTWIDRDTFTTRLYDLERDPRQQRPIQDAGAEKRMIDLTVALMRANACPPEQFQRLGLA